MGGWFRAVFSVALFFMPSGAIATVVLSNFQACTLEEPATKERLNCYDAIVPPQPRVGFSRAKAITECRFFREEDARLDCFESFMTSAAPARSTAGSSQSSNVQVAPSISRSTATSRAASTSSRPAARTAGRCPCGTGSVCVGPRGGRYCITSGDSKRYGQ